MCLLFYLIIFFLQANSFADNDYIREHSWQERKRYAKKILNLFINKK
jgi:hypothetical protein